MSLAEVRAELDEELTWRLEELRFFKNRLGEFRRDEERERYRRAMVVMLYAHVEGFWKAAFTIYVKAINKTGLRCSDAVEALVAAAFTEALEALADGGRKSDYFRHSAPDDAKLHRFSRQQEFVSRIDEFVSQTVVIEPDDVVDTESNLKPVVIRKNLFRLGFQHDAFKEHEGTVDWLLNWRNQIAHGATRSGLTAEHYEPLERAVIDVMSTIVRFIYDSLKEQRYLRRRDAEHAI
jgi:hypothetical protein